MANDGLHGNNHDLETLQEHQQTTCLCLLLTLSLQSGETQLQSHWWEIDGSNLSRPPLTSCSAVYRASERDFPKWLVTYIFQTIRFFSNWNLQTQKKKIIEHNSLQAASTLLKSTHMWKFLSKFERHPTQSRV